MRSTRSIPYKLLKFRKLSTSCWNAQQGDKDLPTKSASPGSKGLWVKQLHSCSDGRTRSGVIVRWAERGEWQPLLLPAILPEVNGYHTGDMVRLTDWSFCLTGSLGSAGRLAQAPERGDHPGLSKPVAASVAELAVIAVAPTETKVKWALSRQVNSLKRNFHWWEFFVVLACHLPKLHF